jgi:hypothetical protein
MLERCIADAGGEYLFCDTDSAAIVAAKNRHKVAMPDGAAPIIALSHREVDEIVQRFEKLNPYDLQGSILKIHKLNWSENGQWRRLHGYSIAGKRHTLHTKTKNNSEIVQPKNRKPMAWDFPIRQRIPLTDGSMKLRGRYSKLGTGSCAVFWD